MATSSEKKIDAAVSLLAGHVPSFGDRASADAIGCEIGDLKLTHTPSDVAQALRSACVAAAEFLAREFAERETPRAPAVSHASAAFPLRPAAAPKQKPLRDSAA